MRIDRSHLPWAIFVAVASVTAAILYVATFHPRVLPLPLPGIVGEVPPTLRSAGGTPLGLIFGSLALGIFLFASALGIRKKKRLWPIGRVELWLKAHIWLTVLSIPLVLFHCGFRTGGVQTTGLFVLYWIVMLSGFYGLALQQFMPRLMKERLPREVIFEQIGYIREALHTKAAEYLKTLTGPPAAAAKPLQPVVPLTAADLALDETASAATTIGESQSVETLVTFLTLDAVPYLAAKRGESFRLGDARAAADTFRTLKLSVSASHHPQIEELQTWCEDRRLMDLQTKLHHWLHAWLIVHVPASFALLLLTIWHAWIAVRFLVRPA